MKNQLPKSIVAKIERMNNLAYQAEKLNIEVEKWFESHGCKDAYDQLFEAADMHGYTISVEDAQWIYDNIH